MREEEKSAESLALAIAALKSGGVVTIPTDTVYGLAAHPDFPEAVERIYAIKGRRPNKPIAFLASEISDIVRYGTKIKGIAKSLAENFWPGALTLVLDTGNGVTEGFRIPDSEPARNIILQCGGLLRVTSANFSGEPATSDFAEIPARLLAQCDATIDGGKCPGGVPSAVVKVDADGRAVILREGAPEITSFINNYKY